MNTPYHHFEKTPSTVQWQAMGLEDVSNSGWDKEDTLHFSVDALGQGGRYTLSLEVRTSDLYPYQNLSLMVEEEVLAKTRSMASRRFAVELEPRTPDGDFVGLGIGRHDLSKILAYQHLTQGDSLHVKVYHRMRRWVLPGVTDVGVKLTISL